MTSYYVSIGYNRGAFDKYGPEYEWEMLQSIVREICNNPDRIISEARRLGAPEVCGKGCCELSTYADNYKGKIGENGHPLFYTVMDDKNFLVQNASADDEIKFHVRRAFIRLLIDEMHKENIEVNLKVV